MSVTNSQHQGGWRSDCLQHTLSKVLELKRPEDWDDWGFGPFVDCALVHVSPCSKSTSEDISSMHGHLREMKRTEQIKLKE